MIIKDTKTKPKIVKKKETLTREDQIRIAALNAACSVSVTSQNFTPDSEILRRARNFYQHLIAE